MKTFAIVALVLFTAVAFAQGEKAKVAVSPKAGAVAKYKWDLKLEADSLQATAKAVLETTTKSADQDAVETVTVWKDLEVEIAGSNPGVPVEDLVVRSKPSGEALSLTGGIRGSDAARLYLLTRFIAPSADIAEGESYTVDFPEKSGTPVPAHKIVTTYVGKADLKGKAALKFVSKYSESDSQAMAGETTYWVLADGTLLKAESKFQRMPVPAFGQPVSGSVTLEAVESP
jgi:hypothetical protein